MITSSVDSDTVRGAVIGNARKKFRDGFSSGGTQPKADTWTVTNPDGHVVTVGGNAAGANYLRISLNPTKVASEFNMLSKDTFKFPTRVGFGLSISQRTLGQEVFCGIVGDNEDGEPDYSTTITPDIAITGTTLSVTSNVATITATNHGLKGVDRVVIIGCPDSRCNVGPVIVTVVDVNTITVPLTIGNGTYSTVGAYIRFIDPFRWAYNGAGYLFENATATNASEVVRRNGTKFRSWNQTVSTTAAQQLSTSPLTDAFAAAAIYEIEARFDELSFRSYGADSISTVGGIAKYSQVPDEDLNYRLCVRARNLSNYTVPVGRITAAAKSGSTTATITTDVPHGLTTSDYVRIYGIRDQTNFANQATDVVVASVPSSTTFTVVFGASATATSAGGAVWRIQGGTGSNVWNVAVQSISRTNGIMTVIGNTTWGPLPGEYMYLYGLDGAGLAQYEGAYKTLRVSTTTLELEAPGPDFTSVNSGGVVIRMTDVRVHFVRVLDYTRLVTEVTGGRGNTSDVNNAVPVAVVGNASQSVLQGNGLSSGSSAPWLAAGLGGVLGADVASAAITSTTTTATVTPGVTGNIGTQSHEFSVIVTAVSGTNPTMDVVVQESPDNGTNWVDVYHFPRITATGTYVSPQIPATHGTRYRYVQTIGGTTPSFTRAINRVGFSHRSPLIRQFYDRTINPNTTNSTSVAFNMDGCRHIQLVVNMGAITTTAPSFKLQACDDFNNANWYDISTALLSVANSTVMLNVVDILPKMVRVIESAGGNGATLGYISIKGIGY